MSMGADLLGVACSWQSNGTCYIVLPNDEYAKRARFGYRHNAFFDLTIIRMIVLLGRFELGLVARLVYIRDGDGDRDDA